MNKMFIIITIKLNKIWIQHTEACHGIFEFLMHNMSHSIYPLGLHLEGEPNLYFGKGEKEASLSKNT